MDSALSKTARSLARGGPRTLVLLCVFGGILLLSIAAYSVTPEVGNGVLEYASQLHASLTGGSSNGAIVVPSWHTGPVVFVLVMFGAGSAVEGQHMVKSIIMHSSRPVQLHIICTSDAMEFLQRQLALVTRPAYNVKTTFYPLAEDAIAARAQRAGIANSHHAGVGGLAKMFIHEILPETVHRAIYVDTDAVFATDPALIWRDFHYMPADAVVSVPHAGPTSNGGQLCTCVIGLNLDAMRNMSSPLLPSTLIPSSLDIAFGNPATFKSADVDPQNPFWGDQSLFWAMWKVHPERFGRLPRTWDTSKCTNFHGMFLDGQHNRTAEQERVVQNRIRMGDDGDALGPGGILWPGIIHFNCMGSEDSVFDSEAVRGNKLRWGPLVTFTAEYKWVWLNRGLYDPEATTSQPRLVTHVVQGLRFLDEIVAEEMKAQRR